MTPVEYLTFWTLGTISPSAGCPLPGIVVAPSECFLKGFCSGPITAAGWCGRWYCLRHCLSVCSYPFHYGHHKLWVQGVTSIKKAHAMLPKKQLPPVSNTINSSQELSSAKEVKTLLQIFRIYSAPNLPALQEWLLFHSHVEFPLNLSF